MISGVSFLNPKMCIAVAVLGFQSKIGPKLNKQLGIISVYRLSSGSSQ